MEKHKESAKLSFKNLEFEYHRKNQQSEAFVTVYFLRNFYFELFEKDLLRIGKYKAGRNSISFETSEQRAERKFNLLLDAGFQGLKSRITGKKAVYIHKNSGIPLIGNNAFGIIDRNSSLIEIKPVTGCNLSCIYCSVDQEKRSVDFVVEKDYIIEELKKLIEFKDVPVQIFIGAQGEPLIYADIIELIEELSRIKEIKEIVLSTNGTMLTKEMIDKLAKTGMTRINLSINALSHEISKKICGINYNLKHVKNMAEYIPKKTNLDLMLTPVLVPQINDSEIEPLIKYSIKIGAGKKCPAIGIQKFLEYKYGRRPVKERPWKDFYEKLEEY